MLFTKQIVAVLDRTTLVKGINADHRGLLHIDGKQTICHVVLLNEHYGLVAASCLRLKDNKLDTSVKQQIAVHLEDHKMNGAFKITKAIVHPDYDPDTAANNLAIVVYDFGQGFTNIAVAFDSTKWEDGIFMSQNNYNIKSPFDWEKVEAKEVSLESELKNRCELVSKLYTQNSDNIICSTEYVVWYGDDKCKSPYYALYAGVSGKAQVAGLYSYSIVIGGSKNPCSPGGSLFSFYTKLDKYLPWVTEMVGWNNGANVKGSLDFKYKVDDTVAMQKNELLYLGTQYLLEDKLEEITLDTDSSVKDGSVSTKTITVTTCDKNNRRRDISMEPTATVFAEPTTECPKPTTVVSYVTLPNGVGKSFVFGKVAIGIALCISLAIFI